MKRVLPSACILLLSTACSGKFIAINLDAFQDTPAEDSGVADEDTDVPTDTASADSGEEDTAIPDEEEDTAVADDDTGEVDDTGEEDDTGEPLPVSPEAVADFSLVDLSPLSPTSGQTISPRDLLAQTSGWYFVRSS